MTSGGARKGAGRPRVVDGPLVKADAYLSDAQYELAVGLGGGNVAKGIRAVFDAYMKPVEKAVSKPMKAKRPEKTYEEKMEEYFADKGISSPSLNARVQYARVHPKE